MKFRIDYTKKGSEEVIDKLSAYVEKWRLRKMQASRNHAAASQEMRRRKTHRVLTEKAAGETPAAGRRNPVSANGQSDAYRGRNTNRAIPGGGRQTQNNRRNPAAAAPQQSRQSRTNASRPPKAVLQKERISTKKIFSRLGISLLTFLLAVVLLAICADLVVLHGPSKAARDRFVLTVTETSAGKFLATWFLSDTTVKNIIEGNAVIDSGTQTDTTLIKLPGETSNDPENPGGKTDINSVQLIDIEGKTYKGKLLIVQNPKRVFIGTPASYGSDKEGVSTIDMVRNANALYGINGGGFYDTGKGNGGIPTGRENSDGIVISKGNLMWGERSREYEIIGINKKGILVLGKMTGQQALDNGIVEALNFGPYLVMNGEACEVGGFTEAGLNPRTAIGQRADGAMLLLTIDGRQPSSMGASYEDLIEIMMNYGAVNAANLDGGSSTYMAQNAESGNDPQIITQCASLYGPRKMATSILVARTDQSNSQYE
ncbi:MAG: phosphodiester glycosidase family protein [Clostridia bacterium]